MNADPLRQILSAQPLPMPAPGQWEALRQSLERATPARPTRTRRVRWGILAGAGLLLAFGGLWLGTSAETEESWYQVHALSQLSSPGADPTWVAMEMTSP